MTLDRVKANRREEAGQAATMLGSEIDFFDFGDYPMRASVTSSNASPTFSRGSAGVRAEPLARRPVQLRPPLAAHVAQEARIMAQAHGHNPHQAVLGAPPVFLFEPHQTEQCNWKPRVLLDIGPVWERKRKRSSAWPRRNISGSTTRAWRCSAATRPAQSGRKVTYGEATARVPAGDGRVA